MLKEEINQYDILCGIEEEFLILTHDGRLAPAADDIMVRAAEILRSDRKRLKQLRPKIRALDPEPSPTQIEYVTMPLKLHELRDAVKAGRALLRDAAGDLGYKLYAQSMHPLESEPNPIAGVHINVSVQHCGGVMLAEDLAIAYNHIRYYLPELIAISANTPLYLGQFNAIASNRVAQSTVLKPNPLAQLIVPEDQPQLVRQPYFGRLRYSFKIGLSDADPRVVANRSGDRLVDITPRGPSTNIDDDRDDIPKRSRIEVRIFDTHSSIDVLLDQSRICCALATQALIPKKRENLRDDPYHDHNRQSVIKEGMQGQLIRDKKAVPTAKCVKNLLTDLAPYFDAFNIKLESPIREAKPVVSQVTEPIIQFITPELDRFWQQKKHYITVQLVSNRTGIDMNSDRRYNVQKGSRIQGKLSRWPQFKFEEQEGLISSMKSFVMTNVVTVQNVILPLEKGDNIKQAMTQQEYMLQRFLGGRLW
ncbi:MAG: hypothetical protein ACFFCQ_16660 [Promethearchaeota archaeon]